MTNLLAETLKDIERYKHTVMDVSWVGTLDGEYSMSWYEFTKVADIEYDSGYGGNEIPLELTVVFTDESWMQRAEYDGSEWWDYHRVPVPADDAKKFTLPLRIRGVGLGDRWTLRDYQLEPA